MTKKFRPNQCPTCRSNNSDIACMNAFTYVVAGGMGEKRSDWSPFEGITDRKCNRYTKKEGSACDSEKVVEE